MILISYFVLMNIFYYPDSFLISFDAFYDIYTQDILLSNKKTHKRVFHHPVRILLFCLRGSYTARIHKILVLAPKFKGGPIGRGVLYAGLYGNLSSSKGDCSKKLRNCEFPITTHSRDFASDIKTAKINFAPLNLSKSNSSNTFRQFLTLFGKHKRWAIEKQNQTADFNETKQSSLKTRQNHGLP